MKTPGKNHAKTQRRKGLLFNILGVLGVLSEAGVIFFMSTFILLLFLQNAVMAQSDKLPNFIIIFCDDMGYSDIGPFGAKGYDTPHLDKMAEEGLIFTEFYVGYSVCTPSRAALLTGCYPGRLSILRNFNPKSKSGLNPDEMTIAEVLKQKKYATAMYGKWHLGHLPKFLPTNQGFDEYYGLPYSNDMWPHHPTEGDRFPDLPLYENTRVIVQKVTPELQKKLTANYTERAVKFIEKNKDRPFFIYLPHGQPHVPLFVSEKFSGKTKRGLYGDVLSEIDWSVGQILKALKDNGVDDNTLVVFTSDNGPWLSYGNHGGRADPLRNGKASKFEGGYRVPCVMRWPNYIPAGGINRNVCGTIDLLPTIANLASVPLPVRKIDGKNISNLLHDRSAISPHEAIFMGHGPEAVRSGRWKLLLPHESRRVIHPGKNGLPGERQKFKVELSLYDLEDDLSEKNNVADKHPGIVKRLRAFAEAFKVDIRENKRDIGE